ncbi:MAG: histidine phosphatase family protein [Anderseniella sp.]|nr:histidine phosphatase family protein [Anderseniella sp.]
MTDAAVRGYPEIWFVRHGETDWNRDRRIQGQTDIELNETGKAQARAIAMAMRELHGSLDHLAVHVSPLKRPRQTLAHILEAFGQHAAQVSIDERLKELNFGEAEGKTWPELNRLGIDPEADPEGYHAWRPAGGESYADATARVRDWLDSLDGPVLAVAHGGISRILRGLVLGLPVREIPLLPNPQWKFYRLKGGRIEWYRAAKNQP